MRTKFTILIADDDLDDQDLMRRGLSECRVAVNIIPVFDGVQVMDYLLRRHQYRNIDAPPDLILLDLNMPLMDGFQTLKEIKKYIHLRPIPIYVITTSRDVDHMSKALDLGATGLYSKGSRSKDIVDIMRKVCKECFEVSSTQEVQDK
jgi:two-component system response regulator